MPKNPAAVELGSKGGKKRWENKTPEEKSAHMSMMGKSKKKRTI